MSANWLLEDNVFTEDLGPLKAAITSQSMEWKSIRYQPFGGDAYDFGFSEDSPVVFYGSLNLAKYIQSRTRFEPGAICSFANFECLNYYPHFSKHLFNQQHIILPLSQAIKNRSMLMDQFGVDGYIYARPNDGEKSFKGKLIKEQDFTLDGFGYGFYHENENLMVVLAKPKNPVNEWRFFVDKDGILAGSSYMIEGRFDIDQKVPYEVENFACDILLSQTWLPDPVFVIDIVEDSDDRLALMEINSASCSGLYGCDPTEFVRTMSFTAVNEFNEVI